MDFAVAVYCCLKSVSHACYERMKFISNCDDVSVEFALAFSRSKLMHMNSRILPNLCELVPNKLSTLLLEKGTNVLSNTPVQCIFLRKWSSSKDIRQL